MNDTDPQIIDYCNDVVNRLSSNGKIEFILSINTMPPHRLVFTELSGMNGERGSIKVKRTGDCWQIMYKGTTRRCKTKDALKGIYCAVAGEVLSKNHRGWDSERV